uniref:Uncharacterized protein n=1 Tax=Arundo donax TaxID=35708 RepID=A0A0A9DJP6_ARUDO
MPIVDKLPALLRQDLESALEDELHSIFDVTQLRQSLGQRKRELEIELKPVPIAAGRSRMRRAARKILNESSINRLISSYFWYQKRIAQWMELPGCTKQRGKCPALYREENVA